MLRYPYDDDDERLRMGATDLLLDELEPGQTGYGRPRRPPDTPFANAIDPGPSSAGATLPPEPELKDPSTAVPTGVQSSPATPDPLVTSAQPRTDDEFGSYFEGVERPRENVRVRYGPWKGAAKGAITGASVAPQFTMVTAPIGAVIGGAIGSLGHAASARTDISLDDATDIVQKAYTTMLGREGSQHEIMTHLRNQGWETGDRYVGEAGLTAVLQAIQNSPEAKAHATAGPTPPPTTTTTTPTTTAPGPFAGGPNTGLFEGFNFQRPQDPSTSAKDSFARAAAGAGTPPPGSNKADLTGWFNEFVRPGMEKDGYTINWVEGDKFNMTGPQGTGTIDWVRGAGAQGFGLAWQVDEGEGFEGVGGGGGGGAGGGSGNLQGAFQRLQSLISPNASRESMEAAITSAFGDVPGFEEAYKESVKINGQWYDLVGNYGGANPTWQLMPKDGGSGGGANAMSAIGGGNPILQGLVGGDNANLDAILKALAAIARGENAPQTLQAALLRELEGGAA